MKSPLRLPPDFRHKLVKNVKPRRLWERAKCIARIVEERIADVRFGHLPLVLDQPPSLETIDRLLRRGGLRVLPRDGATAGQDRAGALLHAAYVFLTEPYGLTEHPLGPTPAFWARYAENFPAARPHLPGPDAVLPGEVVWHAYDHHPDWRELAPLALTPPGRRIFFRFLLRTARKALRLPVEDLVWFMIRLLADRQAGLWHSYRRNPDWQEAVPRADTPAGWAALCQRAKRIQQLSRGHRLKSMTWLENVPVPPVSPAAQATAASETGVNVIAHFRYPSGLQEAALNTVRALRAVGLPHGLRDAPIDFQLDVPGREGYLDYEVYEFSLLHLAPIPNPRLHYPRAGLWQRPGVRRSAVWYWELDTVPPEWIEHAASIDSIWAPTRFIQHAFEQVMPIPVRPMLPGVPTPLFDALPKARFGLDPACLVFYFAFDMNSVMERKNPLAFIAAFEKAFPRRVGVQLAIKVSRGKADPEALAVLQAAVARVDGVLIDVVMSREEAYALMNACDVYVSLHRSEGFGLTIAEAMLMGKPTVATAYSGNLDFTDESTCCLIPQELIAIRRSYPNYPQGGRWADPCVDAAAEALRKLAEDRDYRQALARRGEAAAKRILSLPAYGERIRQALAGR
jgi:glycosyltransferase involved in cell wall biosynthesis